MELELDGCTIRSWRIEDVESLVRHANNYNVWRNLRDRFPHPYTESDARWWIGYTTNRDPQTEFAISINNEAVGGIGASTGDDVHRRSAEIGYWLGEDFWGRGIVTQCVRALTDYTFEQLDVCRIYASVLEWNPASVRVLEKAGYQFEGRLRRAATKDGKTLDELVYAIVR